MIERMIPDWIKSLEDQPCECVRCDSCGGSGNVWFDFRGRYLGNARCDDMDELELCEECHGGIVEFCYRCQRLEEFYQQQEDMETR